MRMKIELWLIFLSVFYIVVLCKHQRVNKCTQPGACGRQNAMHASATAALTKLRSHRKRVSLNMKSFGRSSHHHQSESSSYGARTVEMNATNLKPTLIAVLSLAENIITALIIKERSIGINIKEYMDSTKKAHSRLRDFIFTWTGETPDILDFIDGVTLALDDLTTSSPEIIDDFFRIRDLQGNQSLSNQTINKTTRLRFNYKRKGKRNISSNLLPSKSSKKRKVYAKLDNSHWWRPIIRFKEYLKYADLWMRFLEELNLQLETAETQLRRNELRVVFEFVEHVNQSKIDNMTDLFVKINRHFDLPSMQDRTQELIQTANENRLKYLSDIIRINILTNTTCLEINNIAYAVAPHLTIGSAAWCVQSLPSKILQQINAVAFVGGVRFFMEIALEVNYLRYVRQEFGKGFHLIIISPEWVPLASDEPGFLRTINLRGLKGNKRSEFSPDEGEAGHPGEEGGSFYGFGSHVQGAGIRINMRGGEGGDGEHGFLSNYCVMTCVKKYFTHPDYGILCCEKYTRFLIPGIDGGKPGLGGGPGQYKLYLFTNESQGKINFHQENGEDGLPGPGSPYLYKEVDDVPEYEYLQRSQIKFYDQYGYCTDRNPSWEIAPPLRRDFSGADGASKKPQQPPKYKIFGPQNSVPAIILHKLWSLKYSHVFNTRRLRDFSSKSDKDTDFQSLLSTLDLIEEFQNLEKEAQAGYLDLQVLKLSYQSIASRAQQRARHYANKTVDDAVDHFKMLSFLSSAARSKLLATTNPYEPAMVVDMVKFLTEEKTRVDALNKTKEEELQYDYIALAVASYNQRIQDHFKEADFQINNTINLEIEEIEIKMKELAQVLLDKIKNLKEDENVNREKLKEYRAMLQSHQTGNFILDILKVGGNMLAVFVLAAGAISVGVDLGNALFNHKPTDPGVKPVNVPEAVSSGSMRSALSFRKSTDYNLKGFTRQLQAIKIAVQSQSEYFPSTLQIISSMNFARFPRVGDDVNQPIDEFPVADCLLSFKLLMTTQGTIREVKLNISAAINLDLDNVLIEKPSSKALSNTTKHLIEKAGKAGLILLMGPASTFNQWNQDQGNVDEVCAAVEASEKRSMAYQKHIERIENILLPQIDNMFRDLSDERQDREEFSSLALMVVRHTMQKTLTSAKLDYKKEFLDGTGLENYFERALQSATDAMEKLINMYERLDAYQEQAKLANFTAEVALNPKQYLEKLLDEKMQQKYDELRYTMQGQILLKSQSLVEGAFRMWKFPMVEPALCDYKNLSATTLDFSTSEKVYKFLDDVVKRINDLLEFVRKAQSGLVSDDPYIIKSEFNHRKPSYPFYKWENSSNSEFITTMLQGRQTCLRSIEFPGVPICEAVKFRRVSLSFGSPNGDQALEDEMKSVLNDYRVTLTHTGNSFYLFANQSFVINSEKIELVFSFELDIAGVPVFRNNVYDKVLKGDLTLSPYTTWLIKVEPVNSQTGFEPLLKFAGKFDLYLEGNGTCVSKSFATEGNFVSPICEDH